MRISMIAAASENNVIGKSNDLVWHMPADFKYFKEKTNGHVILMGRKTFESLGKPLKNRTHVIISTSMDENTEGVNVFRNLQEGLDWAKSKENDELFIIGGANIYKQCIAIADRIYLTRIHGEFEGDSFFPEIDSNWELTSETRNKSDEKNPYDYTFLVFDKRN